MTDILPELPNPVDKALEANTNAETELNKDTPDIAKAQAWAAVAANWLSMVDPRSPEVRRLTRVRRQV